MEFFVTGATGFLGGALVRQLLEADHEVTALVRSPAKASTLPEGADPVEGDVTEKASLRAGIEGVDGVFHLAGWFRVGPAAYDHARRVNVDGTRNVLELVEEFAVDRAVYTSTLAVNSDTGGEVVDETHRYDGPHLSAYDRSKWEAHHEVAVPMIAEGLPLVIAMPGVIYGPGDTSDLGELWRRYLVGDLPVIPRRTAYCWGHVEDTARALRSAMRRGTPGESYIVAGEPATLVEAMAIAEGVTGIPSPRPVSPAWFRGCAAIAAVIERFATLPGPFTAESLRVFAGATYLGDNTKARRELGVAHRPLETGLREYLEWERDRTAANFYREPA